MPFHRAAGADAVVITSGAAATVIVKDPEAVPPALSFTVAVTLNRPAALGVPLMAPAADAITPPGSPATVHVYGRTPPAAASDAE